MSNKTKWKWIAQDKDWKIYKYDSKPNVWRAVFMPKGDEACELVQGQIEGLTKYGWEESLINLETHDYKIMDGILIKVDKQDKQQKHQHYKKDVCATWIISTCIGLLIYTSYTIHVFSTRLKKYWYQAQEGTKI